MSQSQSHLPSFDESRQALLHEGEEVQRHAKRAWEGFSDFALRDNVLEVAVGLILAAAFTTVVSAFVSDILLPPISLLPFLNKNLDEKFAVLRRGQTGGGGDYNTLKQALADGAVVLAWGDFVSKAVSFLGISGTLYAVARVYGMVTKDSIIKAQVRCKYCRKYISEKAQRCVNCTSWQDGRDDK